MNVPAAYPVAQQGINNAAINNHGRKGPVVQINNNNARQTHVYNDGQYHDIIGLFPGNTDFTIKARVTQKSDIRVNNYTSSLYHK